MTNWKPIDRDSITDRYKAGESARSIAKDIGVAVATVTGELRRRGFATGFPTMHQGPRIIHDWDAIVANHMDGIGKREIQRTHHIAPNVLARGLKARGIKNWPQGHKPRTKFPFAVPDDKALLGYIAGLLDGEGTVMVYDRERSHSIHLSIYNTSVELMEWLTSMGGSVHWVMEPKSADNYVRKPQGRWGCHDAQSQHRLLCAILPYLIIKKERAIKAVRLLERTHPLKPYDGPE